MTNLTETMQDYGFHYRAENSTFNAGCVRAFFDDGELVVVVFDNPKTQNIKSESRISLALGDDVVMNILHCIAEEH